MSGKHSGLVRIDNLQLQYRIPGALLLPATLKTLSATMSPTRKTRTKSVVYLQEIRFLSQAVVASSKVSDRK